MMDSIRPEGRGTHKVTLFYCDTCQDDLLELCRASFNSIDHLNITPFSLSQKTKIAFPVLLQKTQTSDCVVCLVCRCHCDIFQEYFNQVQQKPEKCNILTRIFFGVLVEEGDFLRTNTVCISSESNIEELTSCVCSFLEDKPAHYNTTYNDYRLQRQPTKKNRTTQRDVRNVHTDNQTVVDRDETSVKVPIPTMSSTSPNAQRNGNNVEPDEHNYDYAIPPNNNGDSLEQRQIQSCDQFVNPETRISSKTGSGPHIIDSFIFPVEECLNSSDLVEELNALGEDESDEREMLAKYILNVKLPYLQSLGAIDSIVELLKIRHHAKITDVVKERLQSLLLRLDFNTEGANMLLKAMSMVTEELTTTFGDVESLKTLSSILTMMLCRLFLLHLSQANSMKTRENAHKRALKNIQEKLDELKKVCMKKKIAFTISQTLKRLVKHLRNKLGDKSLLMMEDWQKILTDQIVRNELLNEMKNMHLVEITSVVFLCLCLLPKEREGDACLDLLKKAVKYGMQLYRKEAESAEDVEYFRFIQVRTSVVLLGKGYELSQTARETLMELVGTAVDSSTHAISLMKKDTLILAIHSDDHVSKRGIEIMHKNSFGDSKQLDIFRLERCLQNSMCTVYDTTEKHASPQWKEYEGRFGEHIVTIYYRDPNAAIFLNENILGKAACLQTEYHMNNLNILSGIQERGIHLHIVPLVLYQTSPAPVFYGIKTNGFVRLHSFLRSHRKIKDYKSQLELSLLLMQAVSAIRHLHSQNVIHRDITTCRFLISRDGFTIKLADFRLATVCRNVRGIIKPDDAIKIAVRWCSRESLKHDVYSKQSDVWNLGTFFWEVYTHGAWPFADYINYSTEEVMGMVINQGLNPTQHSFISDKIFKLILRCLERVPNRRIKLENLELKLKRIVDNQKAETDIIYLRPVMQLKGPSDSWFLKQEKVKDCLPELGIPKGILQLKANLSTPYENLKTQIIEKASLLTPGDLVDPDFEPIEIIRKEEIHVREPLNESSHRLMLPWLNDLHDVAGLTTSSLGRIQEDDTHYIVHTHTRMTYLLNEALTDVYGSATTTVTKKYPHIVKQLAKRIEKFHDKDWIVRCLSARDIFISKDGNEVQLRRLARACPLPENEIYIVDDIFHDRLHWLPLEVLRENQFSKRSDMYSLACAVYEIFTAINLRKTDPTRLDLWCVPFAEIGRDKTSLITCLINGDVPDRPDLCPQELYKLLCECWQRDCVRRPTIREFIIKIDEIASNLDTYDMERDRHCTPKDPHQGGQTISRSSMKGVPKGHESHLNRNTACIPDMVQSIEEEDEDYETVETYAVVMRKEQGRGSGKTEAKDTSSERSNQTFPTFSMVPYQRSWTPKTRSGTTTNPIFEDDANPVNARAAVKETFNNDSSDSNTGHAPAIRFSKDTFDNNSSSSSVSSNQITTQNCTEVDSDFRETKSIASPSTRPIASPSTRPIALSSTRPIASPSTRPIASPRTRPINEFDNESSGSSAYSVADVAEATGTKMASPSTRSMHESRFDNESPGSSADSVQTDNQYEPLLCDRNSTLCSECVDESQEHEYENHAYLDNENSNALGSNQSTEGNAVCINRIEYDVPVTAMTNQAGLQSPRLSPRLSLACVEDDNDYQEVLCMF